MTAEMGTDGARDLPPGDIIGISPFGRPAPRLTVAVCRAGGLGVLDLGTDRATALAALADVTRWWPGPFGVRVPPGCGVRPADLPDAVSTVVVDAAALRPEARPQPSAQPEPDDDNWTVRVTSAPKAEEDDGLVDATAFAAGGRRLLVEVVDAEEAAEAVRRFDGGNGAWSGGGPLGGLIARGSEGGGRVGLLTTFVLLQRLLGDPRMNVPVWASGGIGPHTAAAAVAGGAVGVVLDSQLALVREVSLPADIATAIAAMDGTETRVVNGHRLFGGLPLGQDGAFARPLASRYKTAGGVVQAVRKTMAANIQAAMQTKPLAPRNGAYPVAQTPITRISDRPSFAATIAQEGGLPFLALAQMNSDDAHGLMRETAERVGDKPWGVGVAGFLPPELRDAQLDAIRHVRPSFALITEENLDASLEEAGISTYLYAPTPAQLDRLLAEGVRRFVFEGSECGGHIGPYGSFALWEAQVERLLAVDDEVSVMFAGGIHDERSAAMVATLAGSLAAKGAEIRVLIGTAYLFTYEAVASGAVTPGYQQSAIECDGTVLLETEPGRATRCAWSPYVETFVDERRRLEDSGALPHERGRLLEELNVGRLRIAAKGMRSISETRSVSETRGLISVDAAEQRREGLFLMGQIAALRWAATSINGLHEQVSTGATSFLATRAATLGLDEPEGEAGLENPFDIAIVGIGCVFPGAADTASYWASIVRGTDAGESVPCIPFDALAHGVSPESLADIAPAQLLGLEVAARALGDAGYADRPFDRSRASVIFGTRDFGTSLMVEKLGLGGASFTVDAEGASTLAALYTACKELLSGNADLMLCGGAGFRPLREGVACVVLKRLADAERDGDRVYAVVKSVAGAAQGALEKAYRLAGVSAWQVGLAEADGELIKTAYALHTGVLPEPGRTARPWGAAPAERHASVGVTGFHAVLAGYGGAPEPVSGLCEWPAELFLIRGADRATASAELDRLGRLLGSGHALRDLARTFAEDDGPVQLALVASSLDDLETKLALAREYRPGPGVYVANGDEHPGQVAFLYPGQGSQRPGMLAELFVAFPRLQRLLRLGGGQYIESMFPPAASTPEQVARPALGIAGLAVHRLLTELGVRPDLAAGHTYGELVALCAAGVFAEEDLIDLNAELAHRDLRSPAYPVWSGSGAVPYDTDPVVLRATLAEQLAEPVRFVEQIEAMYEAGARVFVEAGPGRVLTQMVGRILGDRTHTAVGVDALSKDGAALGGLQTALAQLAVAGVPVDPLPLFAGRDARVITAIDDTPGPCWIVDGRHVRTADGVTLKSEPHPAKQTMPGTEAAVLEYLRIGRDVVAAQCEVVLKYLAATDSHDEPDPGFTPQSPLPVPEPRLALPGEDVSPEPPALRQVVRMTRLPDATTDLDLDTGAGRYAGKQFVIVDDCRGIALELAAMLERLGARVRTPMEPDGPCDGLVHLGALRPSGGSVLPGGYRTIRDALAGDLQWLVLATGSGGTFGRRYDGSGIGDPTPGAGLRGLARTFAREHPDVMVRSLDVDTKDSPRAIAQRILAELADPDAPVEVGHDGEARRTLTLVPSEPWRDAEPRLDAGSVVLLTGGAITARMARELARTTGCRIELAGRAPEDPQALVDDVYARHGRLDGIVHAILEAADDWAAVDTARALAAAVRPDIGFFAVVGDVGAVATDACGTLAHVWRTRLDGRVLVAGWTPGLDPGPAMAALIRELAHGDEVQVVFAAARWGT